MRRLLSLAILVLVAGLLPVGRAAAATNETVYDSAPAGWGSLAGDCPNGAGEPHSHSFPSYGPQGVGSLQMVAAEGQLTGPGTTFGNFGSLHAMQAVVRETAGSRFEVRIEVVTSAGYRTLVWAPDPTDNRWTLVEPSFDSTVWDVRDSDTGASLGSTTLADYQAAWPTRNWSPSFVSAGCTGASTVYMDALYLGAGATVDRVYNFEARPTAVTMDVSTKKLTFGQKVRLSTTATSMGHPQPGADVQLWAKPAGAKWKRVATKSTDDSGSAWALHVPRRGTTYQWRFPSSGWNAPSRSEEAALAVRAKVTVELIDDRLGRGDRMVAVGRALPGKQGVTATLLRKSATGNQKLGTATVRSDNTFRIVSAQIRTSGSATWNVFVKVPAEGGNLPGKSPMVSARIN